MALIIEDGTIVSGANSFVTVAEIRAYSDLRGLDLPTEDSGVEILAIKAMDYLGSIEPRYQGHRYDEDQGLCFPRECIYYFQKYVGGEIPDALKNAQCQLAFDANENDLLAAGTGKEIIEEKVGALGMKYNPNGNSAPQYSPTTALALLDPLFDPASGASINLISYK